MFIIKKYLCFSVVCSLIILLFPLGGALPVSAASVQMGAPMRTNTFTERLTKSEKQCCYAGKQRSQEHWQSFKGISNSRTTLSAVGHNQVNTGNSGLNFGSLRDQSINSGNQMTTRGKAYSRGSQRNFQYFSGIGDSDNHIVFIGNNQGNSGNSGVNWGDVEDSDRNGGNLIN